MTAKSTFLTSNCIIADLFVGGDFTLTKANAWKRALAPEASQPRGDKAFCSAAYVGSDDERVKRAFEASDAARAAALEIISFAPLFCSKGRLFTFKPRRGISSAQAKANCERLGILVDSLAAALLEAEPSLREWRPEPTRGSTLLFFAMLGVFVAASAAMLIHDNLWREAHPFENLWMAGIGWAAIPAIALLALGMTSSLAWIFAKRSARYPQLLFASLIGSMQMATIGGIPAAEYANANFPSGHPSSSYIARASYYTTRGKNNAQILRLRISPPSPEALSAASIAPDEIAMLSFPIRGSSTLAPPPGPVRVTIERGALGYPLARSIEPAPEAAPDSMESARDRR